MDWDIYPRRETGVNSQHVASLVESIKAGYGMLIPPVVAEKRTYRLTDGWHRVPAWLKACGPDVEIDAVLRTYASNTAALAEAVTLNALHGRPLNEIDKRRVVLMLAEGGMSEGQIAKVLYVTPSSVQRLEVLIAHTVRGSTTGVSVETGESIPLKASTAHFRGRTMTMEQARAQRSAPGTNYGLLVRQLSDALEFHLLDWESGPLVSALRRLRDLLNAAEQLNLEDTA
jgi:hypothetical protein